MFGSRAEWHGQRELIKALNALPPSPVGVLRLDAGLPYGTASLALASLAAAGAKEFWLVGTSRSGQVATRVELLRPRPSDPDCRRRADLIQASWTTLSAAVSPREGGRSVAPSPLLAAARAACRSWNGPSELGLTVGLVASGYVLGAAGTVLYRGDVPGALPTILDDEARGLPLLIDKLRAVKRQFPEESYIIVTATADQPAGPLLDVAALLGRAGETLYPRVCLTPSFDR